MGQGTSFDEINDNTTVTVASLSREPHLLDFSINSQGITYAGTNLQQKPVGYDLDDTTYSFSFDLTPLDSAAYSPTSSPSVSIGDIINQENGSAGTPSGFSISEAVSYSNGVATVTISGAFPSVGGTFSVPITVIGEPGNRPLQTADLAIYKRYATAPTTSPGNSVYTFADGSFDSLPTGWSIDIPATGTNPIYRSLGN